MQIYVKFEKHLLNSALLWLVIQWPLNMSRMITCELQAPMKHWQIWVNHFFSWTAQVLLIPLGLVRISRNKRSVNWENWPVHPYFVKTGSTVQMGLQVFSIQSWSDCCGVLLNILSQEGSSYNKFAKTDLIPLKLWTLTSPENVLF